MLMDFQKAAVDMVLGLPNAPGRTVLELGCGDGMVLQELSKHGLTVRGTTYLDRAEDYIRSRDYAEGMQVDGGINLNQPLPYVSGQFDVVMSNEVIEHIEGHRNFVTEAARVLKPGGYLVVTTPNLNRLVSRLYFALSGVHITKREMLTSSVQLNRMEEYHHRCVDFPVLHWLLWQNGLRIEQAAANNVWPVSRLLLVLRPLVKIFTKRAIHHYAQANAADEAAQADLCRWMTDPAVLSSEQLCLKCRKVA